MKKIRCVKCGDEANKIVYEVGIKVPLCTKHYFEFVEEEDMLIDNVEFLVEDDEFNCKT